MKKLAIIVAFISLAFAAEAKKYKGAEIRTNESFLYGRFEVKMKSADASGMLVSFFTFYDDPSFANNWNEIDIEILGRYQNEVQYNAIVGKHEMHEHRQVLDFNPHKDFHVYSFDWTPDYISWSVDGKEVFKQTGEHIARMNKAQKIMMNIWPSQFWEWTGPWEEAQLPLSAQYDFVKYYEYSPKSNDKFTLLWEDNFDRVDYSRWSFASHTFDGNACDFDPSNAKVKDGVLHLMLTNDGQLEDTNQGADEEEKKDSGKPTVVSAKQVSGTSLKLTFANPVNRINAKKENFKIAGVEILKVKFAMDMTTVELILSVPLEASKENSVVFTIPGQTGEEAIQKISITKQ